MQLINRKSLRSLTSQLLALLMSQEDDQVTSGLKVEELSQHYQTVHGAFLNPCEYGFLSLSELLKSLPYLVEVSRSFLSPVIFLFFSQNGQNLMPTFLHSCTTKKATKTATLLVPTGRNG